MNTREIFANARATQRAKDDFSKRINEKIVKLSRDIMAKQEKIASLVKKESDKGFDKPTLVFKKDINLTLDLQYKRCLNRSDVESDPHRRGSDYHYENKSTSIVFNKLNLFYTKMSGKFNDKMNFFIKLECDHILINYIILSIDFIIESWDAGEDYKIIKNHPIVKVRDKELVRLISYLKKK